MGLIDKAKSKAKEITGDLKEQENANKALANALSTASEKFLTCMTIRLFLPRQSRLQQ